MFCWLCTIVYQYNETNVMHFPFNLLRIKGLYMFRALLAHPQETLHKRHLSIDMGNITQQFPQWLSDKIFVGAVACGSFYTERKWRIMLNLLTLYTATGVLCSNYAMRLRTYTDMKKGILCIAKEYSAVSAGLRCGTASWLTGSTTHCSWDYKENTVWMLLNI
jgi:hypothetical protein